MTGTAVVILAHRDAVHVHRLIATLGDLPTFVHCDARTAPAVARQMLSGLPANVRIVPRRRTRLASWSLVHAELDALRGALDEVHVDHIIVMSGADYPLTSIEHVVDELHSCWLGRSYIWNAPIPYHPWNTPRHRDGGRWRFDRRFLSHRDQLIYLRDIPLRLPWRRRVPAQLELRASSQWKIYSAEHARRLLAMVDSEPKLIDFWRSTLVPEESFAASMLASPALLGDDALQPCRADAWLISWPDANTAHPAWLRAADFDQLASAAVAESITVRAAFDRHATDKRLAHRKWFARKFSSEVSVDLLERIDLEIVAPSR